MLFGGVQATTRTQTYLAGFADFLEKATTDGETFLKNLKSGLIASLDAARHEPCLFDDYQVMVDHTGTVYQIDMDRCFCDSRADEEAIPGFVCPSRWGMQPHEGALNATWVKITGAPKAIAHAEKICVLAHNKWVEFAASFFRKGGPDTITSHIQQIETRGNTVFDELIDFPTDFTFKVRAAGARGHAWRSR
jgi:hypothetical protein